MLPRPTPDCCRARPVLVLLLALGGPLLGGGFCPADAFAGSRTVTFSEGTNFALSLAPDGQTLALDIQGRLWSLPSVGGTARPLTDELGNDHLPRFSPDGTRLVYQSFRTGSFDLWISDASGGRARPLTSGIMDDREPAWFPDGRHIAFSSDRNGSLDIWRLAVESGDLAPLTTGPADDYWPAVSPDGRRLAFVSDRGGLPGLYVAELDKPGEPPVQVAGSRDLRPAGPAWSPDGKALAFVAAVEQLNFPAIARHRLMVLDLVAGTSTPVSAPEEDVFPFPPVWRADGSLLYTADGLIRSRRGNEAQVAVPFTAAINVTTRPVVPRRFRPAAGPQPTLGIVEPVAAPDGGAVYAALGDLWWSPVRGRPRKLTDDAFLERDPAYSPDGRSLAFVSDRSGSMQIWIRDLEATDPLTQDRQVTRMPRGVRYPTFAPDGRSLVFQQAGARGNQDFTLHRLEIDAGTVTAVRAPPLWPGRMGYTGDGRHLLVAVLTASSARFREGRNELRTINLETGAQARIALPGGLATDAGPVVSPDGRTVALVIGGTLWLMPLQPDGTPAGPPRQRLDELSDYPAFSPDGRALTVLTNRGLATLPVSGGRLRRLPAPDPWQPDGGEGLLLIRAGRVFDGTDPGYRHRLDILIRGNRISAVGPDLAVPAGTRVIDARDSVVLPGLIDSHAHHQAHDGAWVGRAWLAFGVTSVVEPGGLPRESRELHEAWTSGLIAGPRLFFAGPQLDGHRRFFPFAAHIESERRLRQELDRARLLDYSLLKTYTRLPGDRQQRVLGAARQLGLSVSSHEVYPALALGGDRVEHLRGSTRLGWSSKQSEDLRMYGDTLAIAGATGATITPTLAVGGGFLDFVLRHPELDALPQYAAFYPEAERRGIRALAGFAGRKRSLLDAGLAGSRRAVADLARGGARVVAGTDAPIFPYGLSLIAELAALRDAGLAPDAVLRAATADAADALGAGDSLGRVAAGWLADLVIVDGDPLADPVDLTRVRAVLRNGRLSTSEELLAGPCPREAGRMVTCVPRR